MAGAAQAEQGEQEFVHETLAVGGMDCGECARKVERAVARIDGVDGVEVSFAAGRLSFERELERASSVQVAAAVRALGYEIEGEDEAAGEPARALRGHWPTAIATLVLLCALVVDLAGPSNAAATALYALSIVVGGARMARSGFSAVRLTRRPDMNTLMSLAVIGAMAIGAWAEGALVVVLFSIGELLEAQAVARARRGLTELLSLTPDTARVRIQSESGEPREVERPVAEIISGEVVVVRPGERIPVDGKVLEGVTSVDQAPITGEATPIDRGPGDGVFAGSLNAQGLIALEATSVAGDTTLDRIGRLIADAQAARSPSERWVDRFASVYTPVVLAAAAVVAVLPPALGVSWSTSLYSALALLILACPCALVISTPVSIVTALSRASRAGVLVKGGAHLETAATVNTVAFDKTGTLTMGRPAVVDLVGIGVGEEELLQLAASVERGSEHPLARAIVEEAGRRGLRTVQLEDMKARPGMGAEGRVGGAEVAVGSLRMIAAEGVGDGDIDAAARRIAGYGGTVVGVRRANSVIGLIGLADELRPESSKAVADLRSLGVATQILSGDNRAAAEAVRSQLGIEESTAELLPEGKVAAVEGLGGGVAMVGDGINDAPALAAADLGIAMGAAGSDTAIEVADAALMADDPRKVAALIGTSRWTRTVVRQNVVFSLATKAIAAGILAAGALPLWGAVVSDVGASLLVTANGLRLLRGRPWGRRSMPLLDPEDGFSEPRMTGAARDRAPMVELPLAAAPAGSCGTECSSGSECCDDADEEGPSPSE
jgi:Cd2+/Zn2+-exporting ATPase